MAGTTGDIVWRHVDPKTWELSNTPSADTVPIPDTSPAAGVQDPERAQVQEMMARQYTPHSIAEVLRLERRDKVNQRKQLRQFHKSLKDPDTDVAQGVQELFDSGSVYMKDGDVYTTTAQPKGRTDALLDAVKQWRDKTGFGEDTYYGTNTYQKQQQDMMEQMGRMGGLAGGQ